MSRVQTRWYPPWSSSPTDSPQGMDSEAIKAPGYDLSSCARSKLKLARYKLPPSPEAFSSGRMPALDRAHCSAYRLLCCAKGVLSDCRSVETAWCRLQIGRA